MQRKRYTMKYKFTIVFLLFLFGLGVWSEASAAPVCEVRQTDTLGGTAHYGLFCDGVKIDTPSGYGPVVNMLWFKVFPKVGKVVWYQGMITGTGGGYDATHAGYYYLTSYALFSSDLTGHNSFRMSDLIQGDSWIIRKYDQSFSTNENGRVIWESYAGLNDIWKYSCANSNTNAVKTLMPGFEAGTDSIQFKGDVIEWTSRKNNLPANTTCTYSNYQYSCTTRLDTCAPPPPPSVPPPPPPSPPPPPPPIQSNIKPVARGLISLDDITYDHEITVTRGERVNIYLSGKDSSDPNGWTHPINGVSDGGRCEFNIDLMQGDENLIWARYAQSSGFPWYTPQPPLGSILNPPSPEACKIGPLSKVFNDPAGLYIYPVIRVMDNRGELSYSSGGVFVRVVEPSPATPPPPPAPAPAPAPSGGPVLVPTIPPSCFITANPSRISKGARTTLTWNCLNPASVASCAVTPSLGITIAPTGGSKSLPLSSSTTFELSCRNAAGQVGTASARVLVEKYFIQETIPK